MDSLLLSTAPVHHTRVDEMVLRLHLVIVLNGGVFQAWMEVNYAFPDTSNQPETNHEGL
jgi:hypothetical protein